MCILRMPTPNSGNVRSAFRTERCRGWLGRSEGGRGLAQGDTEGKGSDVSPMIGIAVQADHIQQVSVPAWDPGRGAVQCEQQIPGKSILQLSASMNSGVLKT